MTFGQLQTFLAVARTGSVRAAAARLVVTEPAVSAAVSALQRELGCPLIARQGRGIVLTAAGETLARYAAELVGLRDQAVRELQGSRMLRLAAVTTAGEHVVPPLLKAFRSLHPDVEVSLEVGNRSTVFDRLLRRDVDLAIGGQPPPASGIAGFPFLAYRLVVVGAADARVDASADETWLLREAGSGTRTTVEGFLADQGISPRSTMTLGSNGAIKQAAALGLGITLLSAHAAGPELAAGTLRRVSMPGAPLRRSWYLLERDTGTRLPEAAAFRDFCRSRDARAAVLAAIRPPAPSLVPGS
ncbi:MAG TPA: LysR family transcriptional regulator [Gaiellales bacterium]|jgi:DNA-binding transcriptional LysR family regulator|nr:LysR family transcriptional regulator [Gaiellales bacterium]